MNKKKFTKQKKNKKQALLILIALININYYQLLNILVLVNKIQYIYP